MTDKLLFLLLILLPLGMWLRLPLPWQGVRATLFDILALVIVAINWKSIRHSLKSWQPLIIFLAAISISWIIAPKIFNRQQLLSGLYLMRTIIYYLLLIPISKHVQHHYRDYRNYLLVATICLVAIGLGQYFISADFRSWQVLGWDPHLYRLVGSFYDPGFLAVLYLLFLVFWLHRPFSAKKILLIIALISCLGLTYARASWLLASVPIILINWREWRRVMLFFVVGLLFLGIFLPRGLSEGTKLGRLASIRGRWINSQQAMGVIHSHWLFGVGYNNIAAFKTGKININSHSLGGFENSFLFLWATAGIAGVLAAGYFFLWLWRQSNRQQKILLAIFLLSGIFNNVVFYPLLIWPFWFIWALAKGGK